LNLTMITIPKTKKATSGGSVRPELTCSRAVDVDEQAA
jgi:hypothetical protein